MSAPALIGLRLIQLTGEFMSSFNGTESSHEHRGAVCEKVFPITFTEVIVAQQVQ